MSLKTCMWFSTRSFVPNCNSLLLLNKLTCWRNILLSICWRAAILTSFSFVMFYCNSSFFAHICFKATLYFFSYCLYVMTIILYFLTAIEINLGKMETLTKYGVIISPLFYFLTTFPFVCLEQTGILVFLESVCHSPRIHIFF